jgi:hypothetical protein
MRLNGHRLTKQLIIQTIGKKLLNNGNESINDILSIFGQELIMKMQLKMNQHIQNEKMNVGV